MPDQVNFEFLRKEAKSILKLCRSRDADALARIRGALPRIARMDDEHAASAIKLADVQYALARESGFENWSELKRHQFFKPGADGIPLSAGPDRWGCSVSYTVRPEMLVPLLCGRQYTAGVRIIRRIPAGEKFAGYANLYDRATAISKSRIAQLRCAEPDATLKTRTLVQGWWMNDKTNLATLYLTTGVSCLKVGDPIPGGEPMPTPEALTAPGGATPENYTPEQVAHNKRVDEGYTDINTRDSSDASDNIFLFSYGEYVPTCDGLDFSRFIERAETLTKAHMAFSSVGKIVRREWFCVTNPNIVVVHIYVQKAN